MRSVNKRKNRKGLRRRGWGVSWQRMKRATGRDMLHASAAWMLMWGDVMNPPWVLLRHLSVGPDWFGQIHKIFSVMWSIVTPLTACQQHRCIECGQAGCICQVEMCVMIKCFLLLIVDRAVGHSFSLGKSTVWVWASIVQSVWWPLELDD